MSLYRINEDELELEASRLCLEFCNTVDWHASDHPVNYLNSYADLVAWARKVKMLDAEAGEGLLKEAEKNPQDAMRVLEKGITLREAVYRVFASLAHHRHPSEEDLTLLNGFIVEMLSKTVIAADNGSFRWAWAGEERALESVLWPIVLSAADLLTDHDPERIKQCADDRGCGWLFYDITRNNSRQWCSMSSCGNRAKAKRHYEKVKIQLSKLS